MSFPDFVCHTTAYWLGRCGVNVSMQRVRLYYFCANQTQRLANKVSKLGHTAAKVYGLCRPKGVPPIAASTHPLLSRLGQAYQLSGLTALPSALYFVFLHSALAGHYACQKVWEPFFDNVCEGVYSAGMLTQALRSAALGLHALHLLQGLSPAVTASLGGMGALFSLTAVLRHGCNAVQMGQALLNKRHIAVEGDAAAQRWCVRKYLWVDSERAPDLTLPQQRRRYAIIAGYHVLSALSHVVNIVGLGCLLGGALLGGNVLILGAAVLALVAIAYQWYWKVQFEAQLPSSSPPVLEVEERSA